MRFRFLLIPVLVIHLWGCEDEPKSKEPLVTTTGTTTHDGKFTGTKTTKFPSGKVWAEIPYKDGLREGTAKNYHENGTLEMVTKYHEGKKEGIAKRYYDSGDLYSETMYTDNKTDGVQTVYFKNGKVRSKAFYRDGYEGTGLVEYSSPDVLVEKYPTIEVTIDKTNMFKGEYLVKFSLSKKKWDEVRFYEGALLDNKYLYRTLSPISTVKGVGTLTYHAGKGGIQERLNIVASVKTPDGNQYVIQKDYPLVIEHPF